MSTSAADLIRMLALEPHPEGGWFREIYRTPFTVGAESLPERFAGARSLSATIHYLLERGDASHLHRLHGEEQWLHLDGGALDISVIDETGDLTVHRLGTDIEAGEVLHAVVPAGAWFGAEIADGSPWALVACITAPAFEYEDFDMGHRDLLLARFPEHADLVRRLTAEAT